MKFLTWSLLLALHPLPAEAILQNGGSDAITGILASLPEGAGITIGGAAFTISYVGGTGNVVLTATGPPPVPRFATMTVSPAGDVTDAVFSAALTGGTPDALITLQRSSATPGEELAVWHDLSTIQLDALGAGVFLNIPVPGTAGDTNAVRRLFFRLAY